MNLNTIAQKLNLPLETVKKESLKDFLERKLLTIETELMILSGKYGAKNIKDFDRLIKQGKIKETSETREDFFRIDALEAKRDILKKLKQSS